MRKTLFSIFCAGLLLACASGLMADTAETIPFLTTLLPGNETPPLSDTASANVIVWVHVVHDSTGAVISGSVDFDVSYKLPGVTNITGLHIHKAPAGTAGSIVIPTDVNNLDKVVAVDATGKGRILKQVQFPGAGTANPTVALIQDLIANPQSYYVNVHTTERPGGLMRGQLTRADMVVLMGLMSPQNETPPVTSNASGVATVVVLRTRDNTGNPLEAEALFNVQYAGFPANTTFTGFHIHTGPVGVAGGVILNTGLSGLNSVTSDATGAGNLNYPVAVTAADANFAAEVNAVNGLFDNPNGFYINLHTTVNPGGEIRSQMRTTAGTVFQESMLPSNETPPIVGLAATGTAALPIYVIRNADGTVAAGTVIFDVNYRGFPAPTTLTGLHIHTGAIGVAGSVFINTGLSGLNSVVSDSGNGNIYKIVTVADKAGIDTLTSIVQTPEKHYVNLHSTVNPGGAIRAQLATAPAPKPVVGGVAATSSTVLIGAPGSILSVYGSNLATFTSDLSGFFQLQALPTSLDGVSATIAGTMAPLYFTNAGQINLQVPFEVAAGQQPLVVTTASGSSAPFNITVASVAPSIFIVDSTTNLGAIVRNSDFSLVTSDNPAKAGDILVIYFTGVGQTTPASQTGNLQAPTGGFNNTVTVTVTIGGQNAPVIYSIASPGFAGLYQAAVTVPAGVSGTSQVVLKVGNAASNSASLPLR